MTCYHETDLYLVRWRKFSEHWEVISCDCRCNLKRIMKRGDRIVGARWVRDNAGP